MLAEFKRMIGEQYDAALCKFGLCVARCPEANWDGQVGNWKFSQVTFHTLYFADLYLGQDEPSLRKQPFQERHAALFANCEEGEPCLQQPTYHRSFILEYLGYCREKAGQVIATESKETLMARADFAWLKFSRAELHVYNIRHVQHHAAQLSLRLRIDAGVEIPWIGSGWRNFK